MDSIHENIRQKFAGAQSVLITAHQRPDGDAIGSVLALGLALQDLGKAVHMVLADGAPKMFRHLPGYDQIAATAQGVYDLVVVVDCADRKRINLPAGFNPSFDLNIDHHITNEKFAQVNFLETDQVATAAILADHLPAWGLRLTPPVAANLMTGMLGDTLGFRTTSTNPRALRQAAQLLETGIDLNDLYMRSLVNRSFDAARYWGAGLSKLDRAGGVVWAALTLADRETSGYHSNDDADLINMVSAIDDFDVALMFVQQHGGKVKISWRTRRRDLDVSRVAQTFGGGGHAAAAGAELMGTVAEAQARVLAKTREMLGL